MQRHEPQSLGDLLRHEMEMSRSGPLIDEVDAINAWPLVIGEGIAAKTLKPRMKNGLMTIKVPSAPLRQELNMMRAAIARAINTEIGKDTVKELKFIGL